MQFEYNPGPKRGESMVTTVLIDRWLEVAVDRAGDAAYRAICHYHPDHENHGNCRPKLEGVGPDKQDQYLADTYRQLVWHLEVPGFAVLLEAQEDRAVLQEADGTHQMHGLIFFQHNLYLVH
jgi:hypothetical protein